MSGSPGPYTLITGGAGFIGTNLAHRLMSEGRDVRVLDNLSRQGVQDNIDWLMDRHAKRLTLQTEDIRDADAVAAAVSGAIEIYHLAAQVAVTSSLIDPIHDFEINARGTLNVLEAMRRMQRPPPLVFTSTNKVYGALDDIALVDEELRVVPRDPTYRDTGVDEHRPLDFHSPYGCSKGAADQYVRDYARCFGLRAVVFRMSCIYGAHQQGNEDQGWVAHFMIRARDGGTLNIFGDGLQVRDVLYVDDLVDAFQLATRYSAELAGHAFNIGGGPRNTLSLRELINELDERYERPVRTQFSETRVGDQRYYVSNTTAFSNATGWRARVPVDAGLERLGDWLAHPTHAPRKAPVAAAVAR